MKPVSLDEIRVAGALDRDVSDDGVVFRRLPAWTRPQVTDLLLSLGLTMPAGVRLELHTDADTIELDALLTMLKINGRPIKLPTFDVVIDGEVRASASTDQGRGILYDAVTATVGFEPGDATTLRFELPATDGPRDVEVWLPHDTVVALRELRVNDGAAIGPPRATRKRWIHYGSSISHCLEAPQPTATWPAIVALGAGVDLQNFGFAGQCMLDQFVARTIRDLPADFISIKAGINILNGDTMRERTFTAALHGFLDTVRDGHPTTPIVLATPIICPAIEDRPGPTIPGADGKYTAPDRPADLAPGALTLRRVRELAADVVRARADDAHLHLLDGLELFGEADAADLYDGLHPTGEGYRRIGERFLALAFGAGGPFSSSG